MRKPSSLILFSLIVFLSLSACASPPTSAPTATSAAPTLPPGPTAAPPVGALTTESVETATNVEFVITSDAFEDGDDIPLRHSCEGDNVSPQLGWTGLPEGAQALALLMTDPDANDFVHWVIFNIPAVAHELAEGLPGDPSLGGILQGTNDFARFGADTFPSGAAIKRIGYDGPCPPSPHRYVFTLVALDAILDTPAESTLAMVVAAMEGHILAETEIEGMYTPGQ